MTNELPVADPASKPKRKRQRLPPEERRENILNAVATIVSQDGVAVLTIERLSAEIGVSKSLIYAYFPNLTELLQALYGRELKRLRLLQFAAAESAQTFERLVRRVTRVYLQYIEENGLLLQRLQSEPTVTNGVTGPTYFNRDESVSYLTQTIQPHFNLPLRVVEIITDISFGLPEAAGNYLYNKTANRQEIEDLTVTMIIGSIQEVADNYRTRLQPLTRAKTP